MSAMDVVSTESTLSAPMRSDDIAEDEVNNLKRSGTHVKSSTIPTDGATAISMSTTTSSVNSEMDADDAADEVDTHTDLLEFPPAAFRRKASRKAGVASVTPMTGVEGTTLSDGTTGDGPDVAPPLRASRVARSRSGEGLSTDFRSRPSSFHRHRVTRTPSGSATRRGSSRAQQQAQFHSPQAAQRPQRLGPVRSFSTDGVGLSAMRNTRMYQQQQQQLVRATHAGLEKVDPLPPPSLQYTRSDDISLGTANSSIDSGDAASVDVDSCFTADSICLRKSQLIADPILSDNPNTQYYDHSHTEDCSYAEHDSVWDSMSQYSRESQFLRDGQVIEYLPSGQAVKPLPGMIVSMVAPRDRNSNSDSNRENYKFPGRNDGVGAQGGKNGTRETVDHLRMKKMSLEKPHGVNDTSRRNASKNSSPAAQDAENTAYDGSVFSNENDEDSCSTLESDAAGEDGGVGDGLNIGNNFEDDDDVSIRDTTTTSRLRDETTTENTDTEFDHTDTDHVDVTEGHDELLEDSDEE